MSITCSSMATTTASSPRFTCMRPARKTRRIGTSSASQSLIARSMLPACTSLRTCASSSLLFTRNFDIRKMTRSVIVASTMIEMNRFTKKGQPSFS